MLFRIFFKLIGIMPQAGLQGLAKIRWVTKTYHWLVGFSPQEIMLEVQGNKMYLTPINSALSRELLLCGVYERGEVRIFSEMVERGMNVLDLGANIGYFTLIAAKLVGPEGRVFAFEPEPKNFSMLERNVRLNGYDNVTLVQMAVSDRVGVEELHLFSDSWGHSLSSMNRDAGLVSVPVTSLDEFLAKEGDPPISFVKMDIEGAESKALQGMERILSKGNVKALVIEFHFSELESQGTSFREMWHQIKSLGFGFYEMKRDRIEEVDYQKAIYLADKVGGCVNLLCLKN